MANANQVIVNGETILDLRSDTVTPETLQKGYTAHDKSGTKITGTLEASSVSVQSSKSVTITSNGTVSVTPDAPYDALKKVDVTVDVVADVPLVTVTFKATQFGDEISSPDDSAVAEMGNIIISAFVDGNISLDNMRGFSQQWGGMVFPFDVAVPQGSSVTICAGQPGYGGSTTVTNAQIAKWFGTEGIRVVYTVYNITDGATITIDVS